MDKRYIFSSTYSAWNQLCAIHQKTITNVTPTSSAFRRKIIPITNFAKTALIALAFFVATIATVIFGLITCPYKIYKQHSVQKASQKEDLNRLTDLQRRTIGEEVRQHAGASAGTTANLDVDKIVASYARSHQVYGPIARAWTEHLLDKANRENKALVFMARDGTAPYKMAKKLMARPDYQQKYPTLTQHNKIVLAYFSRKLVKDSNQSDEKRQLFKEYARSELGVVDDGKYILVDVGFTGTMIDTIRTLLAPAHLEFEYLISFTPQAAGYIATDKEHLAAVPSAGKNLAIHWLEDTHQGNIKSATSLVRVGDRIYPNTLQGGKKEYCTIKDSHAYLLRKFSMRAIVDSHQYDIPNSDQLKGLKQRFDDTLQKIKNATLLLFVEHSEGVVP